MREQEYEVTVTYKNEPTEVLYFMATSRGDACTQAMDDRSGRAIVSVWAREVDETDEEYEERTGEPRGAGADWAGRERGDFQE